MQVELKKNTAFTWGKWGEKNVCNVCNVCRVGEERKSVSLHCSPREDSSNSLAKATVGEPEKDKIVLSLGRVNIPIFAGIRAALWGFGQLFPFSEFFDNPGQSLIQSAKYLLSWFQIGRYQCPPRKEPPDTRFATSPTRHRIAGCERSVRAVRFPETQVSIVSIALRDQLIHNILVWRAVQRVSHETREQSREDKGEDGERKWPPPLRAKEKREKNILNLV